MTLNLYSSSRLPEHHPRLAASRIILHHRNPFGVRLTQHRHAQAFVKRDRARIRWRRDRLDVPAAVSPRVLDKMPEQQFAEASSPRRDARRDDMHVTNRLDLRDESEQIGRDHTAVADYEGRIAELVDQHRMMQMPNLPAIPEIRERIQDLGEILLRTVRNCRVHRSHRSTACKPIVSRSNIAWTEREETMDRRNFVNLTAAAAATSILPGAARAQQSVSKARNVVLVHGLFADGSCWTEVIARLQRKGLNATAVQNPLTSLQAAVDATKDVLSWQQGPTVLVGHSFGGVIVSEAGVDPKVSSLVYVAARGPEAGEEYGALTAKYPAPPVAAGIIWANDWARLGEEAFLRDFAGDLPAEKARLLYAVQSPFKRSLLAGKTTQAAWRSEPSFYAVSTEDRVINPDLQRFTAKRMGAKTIEVKASHLGF